MRFGISWVPDDLTTYGELVRRTEAIGVDRIGVPDTQASVYRECYVTLGHLFSRTERVLAGPLVSNPVTRHPATAAAAIASADELSGGRAFLTLASGDTGVFNLGLKPAKLRQLEEYVLVLRELFEHGKADWQGNTMKLKWVERPVPIFLAADGPKALHLGGKVADGVVVGLGFLEGNVALAKQYIAEGAREAGRDPADIEVWFMARAAVGETRDEALDLARPSLAAASAHAFRFSLEGKDVPEELVEPILELERRYDHTVHNTPGAENPNGQLVRELGLTDYLADRMGILGTEQECIDKVARLREAGVENVFCRPLVHDRQRFLDHWERVIASARGATEDAA
jgi:5,10-methylenetetrahydromethanopterin reductase